MLLRKYIKKVYWILLLSDKNGIGIKQYCTSSVNWQLNLSFCFPSPPNQKA
jgi:hypothetical protein